jgi:hypothetical protein
MALHKNAWRGQNIVILDHSLNEGLKLEQAIAAASPDNEVKIETFSDYSEAYDYCREKANVGLLFVSSKILVPIADAIEQLSRYYQFFGTSARVVLILDGPEDELNSYRIRAQQKKCFWMVRRADLNDKVLTGETLNTVWEQYQSSIESEYFPAALQDSFLARIENSLTKESRVFCERTAVLLGSGLNLSWFDQIALKWAPSLNEIGKENEAALRSSEFIINLAKISYYGPVEQAIEFAKDKNQPLIKRVATVIANLDDSRKKGILPLTITQYSKLAKPGSLVIYRHVHQKADQILAFAGMGATSLNNSSNLRKII